MFSSWCQCQFLVFTCRDFRECCHSTFILTTSYFLHTSQEGQSTGLQRTTQRKLRRLCELWPLTPSVWEANEHAFTANYWLNPLKNDHVTMLMRGSWKHTTFWQNSNNTIKILVGSKRELVWLILGIYSSFLACWQPVHACDQNGRA